MERRFKKIKYSKGKVTLVWEQLNKAKEWDSYSMESTEAPSPSFDMVLQGLRRQFLEEVELTMLEPEKFNIGSVSISWVETEEVGTVMGAVISALRELETSNSPLVLNSPFKPEKPYTEDGNYDVCLHRQTVEAIKLLFDEAELYLEGDRAQTNLFARAKKFSDEWDKGVNAFAEELANVDAELEVAEC